MSHDWHWWCSQDVRTVLKRRVTLLSARLKMAFPAGYFLLACQSRDAQTQVVRLDWSMRIPLVNGVTGAERACPRRQLQTPLISTGVSAPARSGA